MAKRQHISRLDSPTFDVSKFAVIGELPTTEAVNQSVSDVTGVEMANGESINSKPSVEKKAASPKAARVGEKKPKENTPKPKSETSNPKLEAPSVKTVKSPKTDIERGRDARGALNRIGITALVDKDLLQQTKILAVQQGVSMSDIINDALSVYLNKGI